MPKKIIFLPIIVCAIFTYQNISAMQATPQDDGPPYLALRADGPIGAPPVSDAKRTNPYDKKYRDLKTIDAKTVPALDYDIADILRNPRTAQNITHYQQAIDQSATVHHGSSTICNQTVHRLIIVNFAQYNQILLVHLLHYFFQTHAPSCPDCSSASPDHMASLIKHHTEIKLPKEIFCENAIGTKKSVPEHPLNLALKLGWEAAAMTLFLLYDKIGQNKSENKILAKLAQDNLAKTSSLHENIEARLGKKRSSCCW